jgi:hypothetical protein
MVLFITTPPLNAMSQHPIPQPGPRSTFFARYLGKSELGPSSDHPLSPLDCVVSSPAGFPSSEDKSGGGEGYVSGGTFETFLQRCGLRVRAEGGSRRKTGSVGRMDLGGRHGMAWRWIEGFFYLVGPVGSQDRKKGVGVVPSS